MRRRYFTMGMLLCILPWQAHATTLEEAMNMAEQSHPELRMSALTIEAARAHLTEQRAYAYNPELSLEGQNRRLNGGGSGTDYYLSLSQGIEWGGKRDYRTQVAQAALDVSTQDAEVIKQRLSIAAARSFVDLYFFKNMFDVRNQQTDLFKDLSVAMKRRLEAGDANLLDLNLANAALASSLSAKTAAKQSFILAQSYYYQAIGKFPDKERYEPVLSRLFIDWKLPENPIMTAFRARPDLAVLKSKLNQFNATTDLASAERTLDPTISLMSGREAGEQLVKVGISFPMPLWNDHQGAYKRTLTEASRAKQEVMWFKKRLKLEIQSTLFNHKYAMQALRDVHKIEQTSSALSNIKLAKTAFKAGELSLEDLVIHMNQALDARITSLNMMKQAWLARIRVAEVLGHPEYILNGVQ